MLHKISINHISPHNHNSKFKQFQLNKIYIIQCNLFNPNELFPFPSLMLIIRIKTICHLRFHFIFIR
jgi:hypothetical protein